MNFKRLGKFDLTRLLFSQTRISFRSGIAYVPENFYLKMIESYQIERNGTNDIFLKITNIARILIMPRECFIIPYNFSLSFHGRVRHLGSVARL